MNLTHVNGFLVLATMTDETSVTARTIVVCDRGANERDRFVIWSVEMREGKVSASNGRYVASYARALTVAAERAATPQQTDTSPKAIAQRAWDSHFAIACSDDSTVNRFDSPVYRASQRMLLTSIRQAYGLTALKAQRVYDTLIDFGESVVWSVEYVKTHRESGAYSR